MRQNIHEILKLIEIGGGYGGQCLILLNLFDKFNISISKYILIDLENVVKFQEKYMTLHKLNNRCVFLSYPNYTNYSFGKNNYLFSCYSFNEVLPKVRKHYYTNLFPFLINGSFIWPTNNIDLPLEYNIKLSDKFGKFIEF